MVSVDHVYLLTCLITSEEQSPGEIKRREVVLDPQVSPEEIKSREVELGLRAGLLSRVTDIVFVTVLHSSWDSSCVVRWSLRNVTALTFCSSDGPR